MKKLKLFAKIRQSKGLSLIEAVVAIAILAMGLIGALALATFGIIAGGESKTRVVAINLAREGVEVVRNIRDGNWLKCGEGCWLDGEAGPEDNIPFSNTNVRPKFNVGLNEWTLDAPIGSSFDPNNPNISDYSPFRVGIDITNGLYIQPYTMLLESTNFYRAIHTTTKDNDSDGDPDELKVICYVAYQERGKWHLVNVEDHLFNWY